MNKGVVWCAGDKHCVAEKGWLGVQGSWLWPLKAAIDRDFMTKYGAGLPQPPAEHRTQ